MTESVLTAMITAAASLIGVIITVKAGNNKILSEMHEHNAVQDERITNLTDEVHKHNDYAERLPVLETRFSSLEDRISKLERKIEND